MILLEYFIYMFKIANNMPKFGIIISIVLLIASLFLLFNRLFTPQPIQITLQSGQEITTTTPEYFSLNEVLLLIVYSFIIGTAATFLFYNSDKKQNENNLIKEQEIIKDYSVILPLLKADEKKVLLTLIEEKGEILQNKLVIKLGVSKVKLTRLLYNLEKKGIIIKERHGLTNIVKLVK